MDGRVNATSLRLAGHGLSHRSPRTRPFRNYRDRHGRALHPTIEKSVVVDRRARGLLVGQNRTRCIHGKGCAFSRSGFGRAERGQPALMQCHLRIIAERLKARMLQGLSGPHPRAIGPDRQRPSDPITPQGGRDHPSSHQNEAGPARRPGPFGPVAHWLLAEQRHGNRSRCNRCSRRRGRLNRHMGPDILGLIAPVPSRVISAGSGGFASPCRASAARLRSCARCLVPASRRLGWQRITLAISKR